MGWRAILQLVPAHEALERSKSAALKAVDIDEFSPDAHLALAHAYYNAAQDEEADRESGRALALNPNDAGARATLASILSRNGRVAEATVHADWAAALDPLNPFLHLIRGSISFRAKKYDDAVREFHRGLDAAPGMFQFHWMLWRVQHVAGRDDAALSGLLELEKQSAAGVAAETALRDGATAGGYRAAAARLAALREADARRSPPHDPAFLALLYHDAGDDDRALDWVERAVEDGDPNVVQLDLLAPKLSTLPRFMAAVPRAWR